MPAFYQFMRWWDAAFFQLNEIRKEHTGVIEEPFFIKNLGYLFLKIGELEGLSDSSAVQSTADALKKAVASAYEDVQRAILGLKVVATKGMGLVPTFAEYLHEFREQTGIPVKLVVSDDRAVRLSPRAEVQVMRIVQEALTNVLKHARAETARVSFGMDAGQVKITVEDDGCGFDPKPEDGPAPTFFGLQTIRERAESVGGSFQLRSRIGAGTRVIVWLPEEARESVIWMS